MNSVRKVALMGLMLALIFILGMVENMLPPIPFLPPSIKLGLANVVSMYCIFFIGRKEALLLTIMKSGFVFTTRGAIAGTLSLTGGLLSLAVMIGAIYLSRNSLSYISYSILGAVFHNIGQITAFSLFMKNWYMIYYLPVLLIFGLIMGIVTGKLLKIIMPHFHRIVKYNDGS